LKAKRANFWLIDINPLIDYAMHCSTKHSFRLGSRLKGKTHC
jgi:hypothetical protein